MKVRTETSGLRISCATPAASVPRADRRSARASSSRACSQSSREALRGEHGADPGEQAARERSVRRGERLSAGARQQQRGRPVSPAAVTGRTALHGPSGGSSRIAMRSTRTRPHVATGHEPITSGVVGEHRGALQTEAASEELDDGLHGRVTRGRFAAPATRTGASARHTQPPPPLPAGPSITPAVRLCALVDASGPEVNGTRALDGAARSVRRRWRNAPMPSSSTPTAASSCPTRKSSW